jgi:hypothetical protein
MSLDVSSIPSLVVTGWDGFKLIPDVLVPNSPTEACSSEACSSCSERMDVLTLGTSVVFCIFAQPSIFEWFYSTFLGF